MFLDVPDFQESGATGRAHFDYVHKLITGTLESLVHAYLPALYLKSSLAITEGAHSSSVIIKKKKKNVAEMLIQKAQMSAICNPLVRHCHCHLTFAE